MKRQDDADMRPSGLLIGSEPLDDVHDRHAAGADTDKKDGGLLGDKGDDDSGDSDSDTDTSDSDSTDKGDTGDDSSDSDSKD